MALPAYKTTFLESSISAKVLTFGTFTLKSGRRTLPLSEIPLSVTRPLLIEDPK